jgi:hypothetical protein
METEDKLVNEISYLMWEIAYITQNPQMNSSRIDLHKEKLKSLLKEFKQEILKSAANHSNHHIDHLRF